MDHTGKWFQTSK